MRAEWINPFIAATATTFEVLLECDVERGKPRLKSAVQPQFEISGLMSMQGEASGLVVVSLHRDVAVEATRFIVGHASGAIDADVVDVICEMTNMIAGGANNQLEQLSMQIGLPSVITGKNHVVNYPSGVATITIPCETKWGPFCVDASIKARPSRVLREPTASV